jgi:formylglycine-generating enzyme required for sulfatase activity
MAGNVWEWTADWYSARHPDAAERPCCVPRDPRGGAERESADPAQPQLPIPRRVIKGGSFLCADSYCLRYRPAAPPAAGDRHRHEPHRPALREGRVIIRFG